jgi:hypothetical protein
MVPLAQTDSFSVARVRVVSNTWGQPASSSWRAWLTLQTRSRQPRPLWKFAWVGVGRTGFRMGRMVIGCSYTWPIPHEYHMA